MKFNQLLAFEKHLDQAKPNHLAEVYLIVDPEEYMQKKLAKRVALKNEAIEILFAENITISALHQAIETPSLFEPRKCCIIMGIDKLAKPILDVLQKSVQNPHPQIRLVFTSSKMTPFCQKITKSIITLDLSSEKPWERDRRLSDMVIYTLKKEGLSIAGSLADQIVRMTGAEIALIDQELEKLICYLKGKKEVKREDLDLLRSNFQYSIFKIGEAVLENRLQEALQIIHMQNFPSMLLLYSFRNLFQKSLRLKELSLEKAAEAFPNLKGKLLEKSRRLAQNVPSEKLKKGLLSLFELEVMMKNQSLSDEVLQSLLLFKLGCPS